MSSWMESFFGLEKEAGTGEAEAKKAARDWGGIGSGSVPRGRGWN